MHNRRTKNGRVRATREQSILGLVQARFISWLSDRRFTSLVCLLLVTHPLPGLVLCLWLSGCLRFVWDALAAVGGLTIA